MKTKGRYSLHLVLVMTLALFGLGAMLTPMQAEAQKKLSFIFVNQWGPGAFPSVVKQGMDDAAKALGVDAQIVFLAKNDDLAAQLAAFEAALLKNPDGIITTIPNATMFNKVIQQALDKGIPVICSNTDGLIGTGNPLEHKVPYIGSSLFAGGYDLARRPSSTSRTRQRFEPSSAWNPPGSPGARSGRAARSSTSKSRRSRMKR